MRLREIASKIVQKLNEDIEPAITELRWTSGSHEKGKDNWARIYRVGWAINYKGGRVTKAGRRGIYPVVWFQIDYNGWNNPQDNPYVIFTLIDKKGLGDEAEERHYCLF